MGSYSLLSQAPTPVEVELGCDNLLIANYGVIYCYSFFKMVAYGPLLVGTYSFSWSKMKKADCKAKKVRTKFVPPNIVQHGAWS